MQGLNMGTGMNQLMLGGLQEDAYSRMFQEVARQVLSALGGEMMMGRGDVPGPQLDALGGMAGMVGGQGPQPGGLPETVGAFNQGIDQNQFLQQLISDQQPSGFDQLMAALLPLIGTAAGAPFGPPGMALGGGAGSAASSALYA
jgi:hypothetical protein